jgi:hypothetical protein
VPAAAVLSVFLASIGPPIAPTARLAPCGVELERVIADYGPRDRVRWVTRRTEVRRLVRRWEATRASVRWEKNPIAPIPLTLAQALAVPSATSAAAPAPLHQTWVVLLMQDGSLLYRIDASGRTVEVDWEAGADRGAYRFRYRYGACARGPRPVWID